VRRDDAEVTSTGRSFRMRAPATRKARRPIVGSQQHERVDRLMKKTAVFVETDVGDRCELP